MWIPKRMADIFISYSKRHAQLTIDLARDLEANGYTTWWDTGLLPDDTFFPQTIRAEIEKSQAVIVIWSQHAIESEWVYSEAQLGRELDKLLQVRDSALNPNSIPLPFTAGNIPSVSDREKIFTALARKRITPSNQITPGSPQQTGSKEAYQEAANEVKEILLARTSRASSKSEASMAI